MNKKGYKNFNSICILSSIFFLLAILWLWKGGFVKDDNNIDVKEVSRVEVKQINQEQKDEPTVIEEPEEINYKEGINLIVPFTSQAPEKNWDQPWQDACEEAVVLMFDAYYKDYNLSPLFARDEILKMVEWEDDKDWGLSINIEQLQELLEDYSNGLKTKIIENPTVSEMKNILDAGDIILTVANGRILPNPHFRNGGPEYHALIIRGYTDKTFITNDPGTQFGKNFEYEYDDLIDAIADWNDGDVENGRKVILVID